MQGVTGMITKMVSCQQRLNVEKETHRQGEQHIQTSWGGNTFGVPEDKKKVPSTDRE